jgi:hypothetical protein
VQQILPFHKFARALANPSFEFVGEAPRGLLRLGEFRLAQAKVVADADQIVERGQQQAEQAVFVRLHRKLVRREVDFVVRDWSLGHSDMVAFQQRVNARGKMFAL